MANAGQIIEWILKLLPFLEKLIEDIVKIFHPSGAPAAVGMAADEKAKAQAASKMLRDMADAMDKAASV